MNTLKPITVWEIYDNTTKQWKHNHIEYGHSNLDKPIGTKHQNKIWSKMKWRCLYKHLNKKQQVV